MQGACPWHFRLQLSDCCILSCRSCLHDKFVIKYLQLSRCETSGAFESSLFLQICNALHYNMAICKVSKLRYILCMYCDINLLFPRVIPIQKHPWIIQCVPQGIQHNALLRHGAEEAVAPDNSAGCWIIGKMLIPLGYTQKRIKNTCIYMGLNIQGYHCKGTTIFPMNWTIASCKSWTPKFMKV